MNQLAHNVYKCRASGFGRLFDCAYAWEGVHILGMHSPSGPRSLMGQAVHAGTAKFDTARMEGVPITADDAADVLVETIQHPTFDVDWSDAGDLTRKKIEFTALSLHTKYCNNISPRYEFVAVELTTVPLEIDCGNGVHIALTGQLDRTRLRKENGGLGISDVKTGVRAIVDGRAETGKHRPQLGIYELLYEHTTGQSITEPAEIIGLSTSGRNEIATGETMNPRGLLLGNDETPGLLEIGAKMLGQGLFPPNPQSFLCNPKYCPRWDTCPYHE